MNTTVFKVRGHTFVAGLQWQTEENVALARKDIQRGTAYVMCTSATDATVSVGVGPREAAKSKSFAAGLVIGKAFPDAIIFSALEDGKFWVCSLAGGIPGMGFDQIIETEEEARAKYSEATSFITTQVKNIGTFRGAQITVEEAIGAALDEIAGADSKPRQVAAALKPYQLQVMALNWVKFAVAFVAVMLVAGVALAGFIYREQMLDRRKREQMMAQALKSQQELAAIKAKRDAAIATFKADVARERDRFGRQEMVWSQWTACEGVRQALPLSSYGYVPHKLTCDFDAGKAELEWAPAGTTTRLSDRAALPGVVDKYSTSVNAISSFDLKGLDGGVPAVALNPAAVQMAILDWGGVRLRSMRIEPPVAVVLAPPKEVADEPGLAPVKLGSKASLSLAASGPVDLLTAPHAMRMLNSYAVQLKQIVWSQPSSAGIGMRATGVLYLPDANF